MFLLFYDFSNTKKSCFFRTNLKTFFFEFSSDYQNSNIIMILPSQTSLLSSIQQCSAHSKSFQIEFSTKEGNVYILKDFSTIIKRKQSVRVAEIMKAFSNTIIIFALSPLASPYLNCQVWERGLEPEIFKRVLEERRRQNRSLRRLLIIHRDDSVEERAFKGIFKEMCIIFLREFCVDWILQSKFPNKMVYLRYRTKLLRRLRRY